jgi:hypothetical protein
MAEIREGQVWEGEVAALGGVGPSMRWLVISPHGKLHAHSLENPLDLHCMPLGIMQQAVSAGRLTLVAEEPEHPIIRLQREKEARGLVDTHMGLAGEPLEQMLGLLEQALLEKAEYAQHLAGEILALSAISSEEIAALDRVREQVRELLGKNRS